MDELATVQSDAIVIASKLSAHQHYIQPTLKTGGFLEMDS